MWNFNIKNLQKYDRYLEYKIIEILKKKRIVEEGYRWCELVGKVCNSGQRLSP